MFWGRLEGSEPASAMNLTYLPVLCGTCGLWSIHKALYGQNLQAECSAIRRNLNQLVASKNIDEARHYVERLLVLCGSRTVTAEVQQIITCPDPQPPSEIFTDAAGFCSYFKRLMDKIDGSSGSGPRLSAPHCRGFVNYLLKVALPYLPLMSDIVAAVRPPAALGQIWKREKQLCNNGLRGPQRSTRSKLMFVSVSALGSL